MGVNPPFAFVDIIKRRLIVHGSAPGKADCDAVTRQPEGVPVQINDVAAQRVFDEALIVVTDVFQ
ncbi:hypothetical protein D3C85_1367650 [compost metagenome]